jgi:peptide/nickel transport system permease protein
MAEFRGISGRSTIGPDATTALARLARPVGARVVRSVVIIAAIAALNFVIVHLAPGDVADVLAGESGAASPDYIADLKVRFGLDQPLWVQFGDYMSRVAHLDLGYSFRFGRSVASLIWDRLPATLALTVPTLLLAFVAGSLLGIIAARRVGKLSDAAVSIASLVFYAMPIFWIGILMIVLFGVKLGWLPTGGMVTIGAGYTGIAYLADVAHHMVLPVVTLSLFHTAFYARLMRASMLEMFGQDFVTTARAKGLSETRVAYRHVLRNALLPVVTVFGLQIANLLGGAVLVETVFGWPGLGRLAFDSVLSRDLNLLLGILLLTSVVVVSTNILVDLAYRWLDPRIGGG